ncbi:hypothetical protein AaE_014009 [Aphanomyces astaci]|uniref:Uncharacterized protein n=1 Tax=Aphanomyces astaci TaxID=112090 RepID=A0A6A4ZFX6_APHAT|nr:hypothetical protein AaE_014009 [Aphanomyces astaci]
MRPTVANCGDHRLVTVARLEWHLNKSCSLTLVQLQSLLSIEFNADVLTSTIRKLDGMLFTIKTTRIEPAACNNDLNKTKRQTFAASILYHIEEGDYVVYYDETNYKIYCKRSQGRSKRGQRAVEKMPASKGPNVQVQCVVCLGPTA